MKNQFTKATTALVLSAIALSVTVLSGCSKSKPTVLETLGGEEPRIFSNRPIKQDQFIAVLKLQSPGLLTAVTFVDGKKQVDANLAKAVEAEQQQAIDDLKKLSNEIRILFRYKMVLNGLAIVAPISLQDQIRAQMHVAYVEAETPFSRPVLKEITSGSPSALTEKNSVKFIGADKVHKLTVDQNGVQVPVAGKGMKVGIIDTGIDFTHSMFGGLGTAEAYKSIDPSKAASGFPSVKVVGGIDLVGTEYDTGSADYSKHVPKPDENPLDEGGHGTHVAGTVAGIGDDVETYSGVAPEADLFAIKVFGADGSTGDAVVVAALEYAADPNQDGQLNDQLDVVNMSLGSSYGNPHILYGEAIQNLSKGGTVVVASAGNEGNHDYIVGAPSVADDAISVAASIDDSFHNWQFRAVEFSTAEGIKLAEAIEGPISKPVAEAGDVSGKLVFAGIADQDFSAELASQIKGNVAFIDRGKVPFADKVRRAFEAGAVGVVVGNNQPGNPFAMGGEGHYEIPAVMISQALATNLKGLMKSSDVTMNFQSAQKIEKAELIDTLTDFSSRGPRSIDALLKPEISAPGSNIISAAMGKGNKGVKLSGTSMSGPHIAGVMALLKQARPDLTSAELKSILMGHAKSIGDEKKSNYPLSRQGAGRVQTYESALSSLVSDRTAISFGEVNIEGSKTFKETVRVRNISKEVLNLALSLNNVSGMTLSLGGKETLALAPGESKDLVVRVTLDASKVTEKVAELNGLLTFSSNGNEAFRIPVLAMVKKISQTVGTGLVTSATSKASASGAVVDLTVKNKGVYDGVVLPFNLLGLDARKNDANNDPYLSKACDLQAVGYRLVDKVVEGNKITVLQVGAKIYEPMTTWNACELSVLIDSDGDQVAEQELAGFALGNVKGLSNATNENEFVSVLLDATKARSVRSEYEQAILAGNKAEESYADSVIDEQEMSVFNRSTIVIVEADVTKLARRTDGQLAIKVATVFNEASSVEMDDFLANQAKEWKLISVDPQSQAFVGLPESVEVKAGQSATVDFEKGQGDARLLLLMPDNRSVFSDIERDDQLQIMSTKFKN